MNALTSAFSAIKLVTRGIPRACSMDRLDRLRTEDLFSIATGDTQPFEDVSAGLFGRERKRLGPDSDALAKLPKLSLVQPLFEFRLAGKHNLQELFGGSLQIRQQAHLFERLPREILRLIHNQNGLFTRFVAVQQPLVHLKK